MRRGRARDAIVNPYIAFADIGINLVLILLLFIPLVLLVGSRGWDEIRYREYQQRLARAVAAAFTIEAPPEQRPRNDAPGEQRWTFAGTSLRGHELFQSRSRGARVEPTAELSNTGKRRLRAFAAVLKTHDALWHRVRIEAHTRRLRRAYRARDEMRALSLSAARAVAVAQFLCAECNIPPHRLAISGRGHQDPVDPARKGSERNDRIDLLVISPARAQGMTR